MMYKVGDRVIIPAYRGNPPMCGIITVEIFTTPQRDPYMALYKVSIDNGSAYFRSSEMIIDKQYYREQTINELGI